MRLLFLLTLALLVTSSAVDAADLSPKAIIGDWYGEGQPGDPNVYWIDHFGSDGSFAIELRHCHGGEGDYHVEAGSWSFKGKNLRITTDFVNGEAVHYEDEYEIFSFDGHLKKDRLIVSNALQSNVGSVFVSTHEPGGFKLPDCHQTS